MSEESVVAVTVTGTPGPETLARPIAEMGPDEFWAQLPSIGATAEEIAAGAAGTLTAEQRSSIECKMRLAERWLHDCAVPGVQFWMRRRRAMS